MRVRVIVAGRPAPPSCPRLHHHANSTPRPLPPHAARPHHTQSQEFILQALQTSDVRADGRSSRDARPLRVLYARGEAQASAEVQLGKTR